MLKQFFTNKPREEDINYVGSFGFNREICIEALNKTD